MRERGTNVGHSQGGLPGREGTEDGFWRMTTNHQSERQVQRRGRTQSFQEGMCKGCGGQTKGQAGLLIHGGPQGRFYPRGSGEPGRALSRGIMSAEQTSSKMCPGDGTRFTEREEIRLQSGLCLRLVVTPTLTLTIHFCLSHMLPNYSVGTA